MHEYFLQNLAELAAKRAVLVREEAQLWDILARDLKREAKRREEAPTVRRVRTPEPVSLLEAGKQSETKLFVRISEAAKMMGIGRSSLYEEIGAGRIKIRKNGRKTLIAVVDIHAWFDGLPTAETG